MVSVHQDGCIHRDLAARNIFRADGIYKLGDFGLVRSINNGGFYKSQSSDIPVNWTSPETLNTKVWIIYYFKVAVYIETDIPNNVVTRVKNVVQRERERAILF